MSDTVTQGHVPADNWGGENRANGISRLRMLLRGVPVDIMVGGRGDAL